MLHNEVVRHNAIHTLIWGLTEDAGDVGRFHELTIKHLLRALVAETSVPTDSRIGSEDEGASDRNAVGIGFQHQRTHGVGSGDGGIAPRTGGSASSGNIAERLHLEGAGSPRGLDQRLVDGEVVQPTAVESIGGETIEPVLTCIRTSEVVDEDVTLGRGVSRDGVGVGEAVGVVREELEITGLDRRRRRASPAIEAERGRWVGDRLSKEGLGVKRGTDSSVAIVIEGCELTDNVAVHIDVPTCEDRVLLTTNSSILESLDVGRAILQGHKGLTKTDSDEAVDLVGSDFRYHSGARTQSLETLTGADDVVHGEGVCALDGVASALAVSPDRVGDIALIDEHHREAICLLTTQPLAQLLWNTGLQLREECGLVFGTQVECGSVTEVIHLKGEVTNTELFSVVANDLIALYAVSIESGHGAEDNRLTSAFGEVGNRLNWGFWARTLELTEVVFRLLRDVHSLFPELRQKLRSL